MKFLYYRKRVLIALILVASVILQPFALVDMASANWNGQGANRGFFDPNLDVYNDYGTQVLPRDHAGISMDQPRIQNAGNNNDRANVLVDFLFEHYDGGTAHERTGVAYIVRTLLGGIPGSSRTITSSDWTEVRARLQDRASTGNINFFASIDNGLYGNMNTFYNTIDNDIAWYNSRNVREGIEIYNNDGSLAYALWYYCANPVGSFAGLPEVSNYDLSPSLTVSPSVAEGGGSVTPVLTVNNSGAATPGSVRWNLTRFTVNAGVPIPPIPRSGGGTSAESVVPTSYFANDGPARARDLSTVRSGTHSFRGGVTTSANYGAFNIGQLVLPDEPVGTRICFALSVQPHALTTTNWRHSRPICVTISIQPKVQVLSGDLLVGRGSASNPTRNSSVNTSVTNKNGQYFGSWAEYAIVPTGCVTGMASGSLFAGGIISPTSPLISNLSILTFTNPARTAPGLSCAVGAYSQSTLAPNVPARFPILVDASEAVPGRPASPQVLPSNSVNVADLATNPGTNQYQARTDAGGSLTITGGDGIPAGRAVVINAQEETVTITGNITYTSDRLDALGAIPQVVIMGRNIIIADGVSRIDAWLVATGTGTGSGVVNTCGAGDVGTNTPLTASLCATPLTVNGPVIANELILRRTAGSGTGDASGDPAETFNLRPDSYLWATNYNLSAGRLSTVETRELPPRF